MCDSCRMTLRGKSVSGSSRLTVDLDAGSYTISFTGTPGVGVFRCEFDYFSSDVDANAYLYLYAAAHLYAYGYADAY